MVTISEIPILGGEDTYRLIVDSAEEGIWVLDKDDKITFVNNKMVEMTGYDENELIGKKFIDIVDNDFHIVVETAKDRRHKGIRDTYALKLLKKDGGFVWVILVSTPLMDDRGALSGCCWAKLGYFYFKGRGRRACGGETKVRDILRFNVTRY